MHESAPTGRFGPEDSSHEFSDPGVTEVMTARSQGFLPVASFPTRKHIGGRQFFLMGMKNRKQVL